MTEPFRESLISQYEAALSTLRMCVVRCPPDHWHEPVANWRFSNLAFHAAIFADLYLSRPSDPAAVKAQAFHAEHADVFADYEEFETRAPVRHYAASFVDRYIRFCRDKAAAVIRGESDADLAGPSRSDRHPCTRLELHTYNIRHVQHHAAQLSLRLRLDHDIAIPWVGHGWREA
jgi:hypothetical protein